MVPRVLSRVVSGLIGVALSATSVYADVRLAVSRGDVNLLARQSTIREILEEWTKVAGTTFIGLGQLPSEVVTLDLRAVPERQALDILLRSASGYIILPAAAGAPIQSQFGSVLVLTGSVAPAQSREPSSVSPLQDRLPVGVERTAVENIEAAADAGSDVIATGGDDRISIGPVSPSRPGAASGSSAGQSRPLPAQINGLPPGVAPGEPIGGPFSRPGLIPAWLQETGPAPSSGRVSPQAGSATPGSIAPAQMRAPGPRDSLSERSAVLPPPITAPEN